MFQAVDTIPERCGDWKTTELRFPNNDQESFTLYHRDPLEAIRSLWGDPSLAKDIVYKPSKVFQTASKEHRVYNEMWTGKWWWTAQVSNEFIGG
jgi:hypothetical protein